ncbi:hypothetical protein [Actinoplanes sp. NPDC026619]|uniref:hypothetical protein n=1 Tax=Actinoplanes sp. NPDC026619 TaxID=3155798 RepID=UPI0033D76436
MRSGVAVPRIGVNLRLVDDSDDRLRSTARADINTWLGGPAATTYSQPSGERAADLDQLIEHARPILGERAARHLRFHAGLPNPPLP